MHIYKTLNGFGKSICMGIKNFVKSVILMNLHKEKNWNYQSLNTAPYVGKAEWGRGEQKVINPKPDML